MVKKLKKILFGILLLLIPKIVLAETVELTILDTYVLLFPISIMIEVILFWFLNSKLLKFKLTPLRALTIVTLANFITYILGRIIYSVIPKFLEWIFLSLVFAIIIETLMYFYILKKKDKIVNLFLISLILNIISYSYISIVIYLISPI